MDAPSSGLHSWIYPRTLSASATTLWFVDDERVDTVGISAENAK